MKKLSILFAALIAGLFLFSGSHKLAMEDNNSRVYTFASGDSISSRIDLNGGFNPRTHTACDYYLSNCL